MKIPTMSTVELDQLCNEVLSQLEIEESRLLNWGFVDVRSDLAVELPGLLDRMPAHIAARWHEAKARGVQPSDLIQNLKERKLILESSAKYRTRFAESIRLLYLLRQRFRPDDWQTASRLVSDMRLQLQRRRYPRRDVSRAELFAALEEQPVSKHHRQLIDALLRNPDGSYLTLARFQKNAVTQQLYNLRQRSDRALAIGAGTGSGKTKAFYIPAFAEIGATLSASRWVRALAIYPRTELLKDQFVEAFAEARKLDATLKSLGKRRITLGAYYGDTPHSASHFQRYPLKSWTYREDAAGWVCPYFFCPSCDARDMIWSREDVGREVEANKNDQFGAFAKLRCPACNYEATSDQITLTREQMVRQPPDILFTTNEMLNRRLSRASEHHLFGVRTSTPPRLLLLDEIHTYEGINGAQVAYLLRRWRHMRGGSQASNLCIVGLSATLTQAEEFLSKLTGVPLYHVNYITPEERDLIDEGMEYNVVLKGDPVSGTSLLSTSVQTVMLIGRVLDPLNPPGVAGPTVSRGAYGERMFAFTDKLDVVNRWIHIENDAETSKVLAQLRDEDPALDNVTRQRRFEMGEEWRICRYIGHDLRSPLRIDVTSSQNKGVRADADLVIATAALEVGFNDPTVGAVIQHKAPRSMASFLQRKGRAGRTRDMRPWMVVVTSAFGRDRWAFQHSEALFNPTLPPLNMPIDNYYVRKIQAAYALMDWLSLTMMDLGRQVDVWDLASSDDGGKQYLESDRQKLCNILLKVLNGALQNSFITHVQRALGLSEEERTTVLSSVLWGEPRSIFLEVIPTLLRQLETGWQRLENLQPQPWSDNITANPMPDFVPPNLFSDLSLPELNLHIPAYQKRDAQPVAGGKRRPALSGNDHGEASAASNGGAPKIVMREPETIRLLQGMQEFAPGNVSKRYARKEKEQEAHWLAPPEDEQLSRGALPLQYLAAQRDEVPKIVTVDDTEYLVYRPRSYTLNWVPNEVAPTSTGHLIWRSHFEPRVQHGSLAPQMPTPPPAATELKLSSQSPWRAFFTSVRAYTQARGNWVDVTRLATQVRVETGYLKSIPDQSRPGQFRKIRVRDVSRTLNFEEDGRPAALGFTLSVDALEFKFTPLDVKALLSDSRWPTLYRSLSSRYFLYRLQSDVRLLEAELSSFDVEWLWQLELSMLVATAISTGTSLQEAAKTVAANRAAYADRTMKVIFQSQQAEYAEENYREGKLHRRLREYMELPAVQQALSECSSALWNNNPPGIESWLQQCYASSLGAALYQSTTQLVPDIDPDQLLVDVEGDTIWISEGTAGGVGLVSEIASAIALNPRHLDLQLQDAIEHCDREQLSLHLHAVAELVDSEDQEIARAFQGARNVSDLPRLDATRRSLAKSLEDRGIPASRDLIVALNAKFLRPNSGPDTDQLIATLVRHWRASEERIGCTIDVRVMAVAAGRIPEIREQVQGALRRIGGASVDADDSQVFNLLQSLLWLHCVDSCPDCLENYQPFQQLQPPSRALLMALLAPATPPVVYGAPTWEDELERALQSQYVVQLTCQQSALEECKLSLLTTLTQPVEIGFQHFYPAVERITRAHKNWQITLIMRELVQS